MAFRIWLVLASIAFLSACSSVPTGDDIEIECHWGYQGRCILNTKAGTYQHDMVSDPSITIPLVLTAEEKTQILESALAMNFFSFIHHICTDRSVSSGAACFHLRIETPERNNWIEWCNRIDEQSEEARKADKLIKMVIGIVESRSEFKALPRPKGMYM